MANSAPQASDITAYQRTDESGIVDIDYTLTDADGDNCTIGILVSEDAGENWDVPATDFAGDIGANIAPGFRSIIWHSKTDLPIAYGSDFQVKITAEDNIGSNTEPDESGDIVWVAIDDPGLFGHEGFDGEMSKHETTNAQFAAFLNAALASGDIIVATDNKAYGSNGSNSGDDFVGLAYYNLADPGDTYNGATKGGASRVSYNGGSFTADRGYENHPATCVSWYGAAAFCDYYGYRLPTEWEWQAVADYDGSYNYGCGVSANNGIANYFDSVHPNGTADVGSFGAYGYGMCDMMGSLWEWTSSWNTAANSYPYLRGGCWTIADYYCSATYRINYAPTSMSAHIGFRACRGEVSNTVPNLVGKTQAAAEAMIVGSGYAVGNVSEDYSDNVAEGLVISQNPSAGTELTLGYAVYLTVSIGPASSSGEVVVDGPADMTWVYINDSGANMKDEYGNPISHGGFVGYMSKYETTNAQYCEYLNSALADGLIEVDVEWGSHRVFPAHSGYSGMPYYRLTNQGDNHNGATHGGASRIHYINGRFTIDSGFENHPVSYVSWYGATAFCEYYGYRLPTLWEWQAVADYDGSYSYPCGMTIDHSMANYYDSTHPDGTTVVGSYGTYGYGLCNMTGNLSEWVSTSANNGNHYYRCSSWATWIDIYHTSIADYYSGTGPASHIGFRACRDSIGTSGNN